LDHSTKLKVKQDQKQYAIRNQYYLLTTFGNGCDLYTSDGKSHPASNSSNLGRAYELPAGIVYGSNEAKSYLAGSYEFKLKELEVF
jgi:BTB/POZ domain-containing protein KCTD9